MPLNVTPQDDFEDLYTAKFRVAASQHGVVIKYERDRAAIDLGLHLTADQTMSDGRVWFQLKGVHAETLSAEAFASRDSVRVHLEIEHVRAWYRSGEPVYLIVYVESVDRFLAEDVRALVDRQWGDEVLNDGPFSPGQRSVTLSIPKDAVLSAEAWKRMRNHGSMRTDGRSFHGRPLGHARSPLSSILLPMEEATFTDLIDDLLSEHGFIEKERLNAAELFETAGENTCRLSWGELPHRLEVKFQLSNEFIPDIQTGYQREGESTFFHGRCAVFVQAGVTSCPSKELVIACQKELKRAGVRQFLAFVNGNMLVEDMRGYCGHIFLGRMPISTRALHLEDIAYSVCICTNTYLRFRDRLKWWGGATWQRDNPGLRTVF